MENEDNAHYEHHEEHHEEHHNNHEHHEPSHNKKSVTEKIRKNPWIISTFVFAIFAIFLIVGNANIAGISGKTISQNKAADLVLGFVKSQVGSDAELVDVASESGLYKVTVLFQGSQVPLYLTKDGKNLVQGVLPLSVIDSQKQTPSDNEEIPQTDKPKIQLFVMGFCPYGNRAEDTMLPVYNLFKDKVDWEINYIVSVDGDKVSSLHGQAEVDEDIREVCVKNEYGLDKFWEFITYVNDNCGRDGSCWQDGAKSLGIDVNKIQTCFDEQGLDLMQKEAQISSDAGARGSPTLFINGVKSNSIYKYENPEAYKSALCSAFTTPPEECGKTLEGSSDATGGGSCN